jgi:hypothetical protein
MMLKGEAIVGNFPATTQFYSGKAKRTNRDAAVWVGVPIGKWSVALGRVRERE